MFKGGEKKILSNVYYIPGLKSNIISLGQATDTGCEVRLKDDQLMLFDRAGKLMVKTTRSRNRLYKVTLQAESVQCLELTTTTESSRWHARLGHVNHETMKSMIKRGLVVSIPDIRLTKRNVFRVSLGNKRDNRSQRKLHIELRNPLNSYIVTFVAQSLHPHLLKKDMYWCLLMTIRTTCGQYY